MKLLLDEMISPRIARQLRGKGHDVQAIKADRPDLEALPDREILRRCAAERRAVATNDVVDFTLLHNQMTGASEEHYGIVFTDDATMPRNKASISLWVKTLATLLEQNKSDNALRNRVRHLP